MEKLYEVSFEIAGPAAMFTRPDTGAAQVSYPAPTYSSAKGIFEAVARLKSAYIQPTKVEICAPIRFSKYVTNSGGPLRKANQKKSGSSYQIPATILVDVCYRVYGVVKAVTDSPNNTNHLHALQEIFKRRLVKGQQYYTPCLGWSEFVPSYLGLFRESTNIEKTINIVIPSMLHAVFDKPVNGQIKFIYRQNVKITSGVIAYAE
ncbi:MAG: CRISPR-associated protein Cas5 [Nitrospirae bacterium]|nr:CRISPR-associated protein Cas5 [Nitrospirota bacterium]MBF0533942.1 CRISPR-associated protein Cas5 [Nitrospirota bacterium]MBF0618020.1 CRISPR-associated protein Cas5 [Nitrospirota bacterium]